MAPNPEVSAQDFEFLLECLRSIDDSGMVDIAKVANTLQYTNVASAGNRFRLLRKNLNFPNLNCRNSCPSPKKKETTTGEPSATKAGGAKTTRARKGAKVSAKPIPATGDIVTNASDNIKGASSGLDEAALQVMSEGSCAGFPSRGTLKIESFFRNFEVHLYWGE
ncbi:hypothetical protein ARAM_001218 [Aspergillus rambellii]|uniref:Myb-like DNA-binding domain-containing protein n=1 Tax=Aspergillus rambellii TaxID=308745 RepID=A0A0F8X583_9EURO|nr:hypothetical protein ARAM_001218 [Aspergillus rambellii]